MNRRGLLALVALVAVAIGGIFAVRYVRETSDRLTGMGPESAGGSKPTIRFARNALPVPAFRAAALDRRVIDTATLSGRVTLLNFWATWCPPCRAEIPDLIALQTKYGRELQIIGIADDASEEVVEKYAAEFGINYPNVMTTPAIQSQFRIRALPTTYVIDRKGRVVQLHVGQINPAMLELEVRALLDLPVEADVQTFEDVGQISLKNVSHATEIPGVDLTKLTPEQRSKALVQLNTDTCTCGCGLTLAQCRIDDMSCTISLPIAEKVVEKWRSGT